MGGLISLLTSDHAKGVDIILNFEGDPYPYLPVLKLQSCSPFSGAEPQSEDEKRIHAAVAAVLDKGPAILVKLQNYPGCEEHIRKVCTPYFSHLLFCLNNYRTAGYYNTRTRK